MEEGLSPWFKGWMRGPNLANNYWQITLSIIFVVDTTRIRYLRM